MVYIILAAVILAAGLIFGGKKMGRWAFVLIACIALFSVYGLRDAFTVGSDSASSYIRLFNETGAKEWAELPGIFEAYNVGYDYLSKLVFDLTGGDYQFFVTLIAAFVIIVFGSFLMRYSTSPLQSVTYYLGLLLYTFMFSALKQSIAMSFVLLAFSAMLEKKPVKFTVLVLIGALFHFPALVFLPAYLLSKCRMNRKYVVILGAVLLVVFIFREPMLKMMLNFYKDDVGGGSSTLPTDVGFLRTKVLIMIVILIAALVLRDPAGEDRLYTTLLHFTGIAIVFQTFCGYNNIFERLADYYFQFAVVLIPMVFERSPLETSERHSLIYTVRNLGPYIFGAYGLWRFVTTTLADPTLNSYSFFFQ